MSVSSWVKTVGSIFIRGIFWNDKWTYRTLYWKIGNFHFRDLKLFQVWLDDPPEVPHIQRTHFCLNYSKEWDLALLLDHEEKRWKIQLVICTILETCKNFALLARVLLLAKLVSKYDHRFECWKWSNDCCIIKAIIYCLRMGYIYQVPQF